MRATSGSRWIHRHKHRRNKELTAYGIALFRECMRRIDDGENVTIVVNFASKNNKGAYVET